ncbi:hypothetical protein EG329_012187 [Mollisiaceae sp. DMI_Dod_QoI]|nr:hypothetical protein EG329_012187 [Helotiales sp. DMI_Dod_QoI]
MTSPQAVDLDGAPAIATPMADNPQSANDAMDLTAEAQAEATKSSPRQEQPDKYISLQETQLRQTPESIGHGSRAETQQQQQQQPQGETSGGAGDASIPQSLDEAQPSQVQMDFLAQSHPFGSFTEPNLNLLAGYSDDAGIEYNYPLHNGISMLDMMAAMAPQPYHSLEPSPLVEQRQVQAFAKIQFDDGAFFMNTHAIVLGRDQVGAKKALEYERAQEAQVGMSENIRQPITSDSGGILVPDNDPEEGEERRSRKSKSKKSRASKNSQSSHSSNKKSRRGSLPYEHGLYPIQSQAQRSGSDNEAGPIDPTSLLPPPDQCPLVPIHPKEIYCFQAYKGISRRHAGIAYNPDISDFQLHVLGRNGCFIGDILYPPGAVQTLHSGDKLQISGINFTFLLPETEDNGLGNYEEHDCSSGLQDTVYYDENGQPKRFDGSVFRDARGKEMDTDHSREVRANSGSFTSSPEPEVVPNVQEAGVREDAGENENDEEDDVNEDEDEEVEDDEGEENEEDEAQSSQPQILRQSIEDDEAQRSSTNGAKPSVIAKRSGPGRPPKNGVMSKRMEKELKKQAEEAAAARKTDPDTSEAPKKGKVGRPRKHPLPDPNEEKKPKRKYTKRKPKEAQEGAVEGAGSGSGGDGTATKVKNQKPPKPPRSPSPVWDIATLTEEQKIKPPENYVILIYNAMKASHHKEMGLPQIYNAIKRIYPYFSVVVETKGWESSVRHNLSSGGDIFQRGEKEGKGHVWSLRPGASIEAIKKKKPPPPEQNSYTQQQEIRPQYQGHPSNSGTVGSHGYPPSNNNPPNGYPPQFIPQGHPLPPEQQNGFGVQHPGNHQGHPLPLEQQNGFGVQHPGNHQSMNPGSIPPISSGIPNAQPVVSYNSPYAPKPAESNASQPSNQPHPSLHGQHQGSPSMMVPQQSQVQHQGSPPMMVPQQSQVQYQGSPPMMVPQQSQVQYQGSPPMMVPQQSQIQYQSQPQNLYSSQSQGPQHQNQYFPHAQAPLQHHNPHPPQTLAPPEHQNPHLPQGAAPLQHANPLQNQAPPQQTQYAPPPQPRAQPNVEQPTPSPRPVVQPPREDAPPAAPNIDPEVREKIDEMLIRFKEKIKDLNISNEESVDTAIALIKRDGNTASPDPNTPDAGSVQTIIDILRGALCSIPNSGFTAPQPGRYSTGTPFQPSAPVNSNSNSANRFASTIHRPPYSGVGITRPPMHTNARHTDSGSPATPGPNQRSASVSGGGLSTSVSGSPAAPVTPVPVQVASASSPNGANAATVPLVSVSDPALKIQAPAVSTPVERPAGVDVTMIGGEIDKSINFNGQQVAGQKRARDEGEGWAAEEQENAKRVHV